MDSSVALPYGSGLPQSADFEEARDFNVETAHKQLLQALKGIDLKLDGLAAEVRSDKLGRLSGSKAAAGQGLGCPNSSTCLEGNDVNMESSPQTKEDQLAIIQAAGSAAGLAKDTAHVARQGRRPSTAVSGCPEENIWLEIRPGYGAIDRRTPSAYGARRNPSGDGASRREGTRSRTPTLIDNMRNAPESEKRCQAWSPDSMSRAMFEVFSMVMLLYDAFVTPYRMAWDIGDDSIILAALVWATRIFWTIDLFLNLVTGYRDKDFKLVLRFDMTARHYVATWFMPDLIMVTCDWLTTFLAAERWIRWMRLMRLLRGGRQVIRGWHLIQKAKLRIQALGLHLLMDIAVLMLIILWVNHMVCCVWYGIGLSSRTDTGWTWLSKLEKDTGPAGPFYDYLTALHWAITQMTPGSMEVVPESSLERIYNVMVLLLGLLMGSSLVATLTSMLTQYKLRIEAASRKFMMLHQFLNQQGVDARLAMTIKMQARARSREKPRLKAKDVEYLSLLPNALQDALWHAWCGKFFSSHAFLSSVDRFDSNAVTALCKGAVKAQDVALGDHVFEEDSLGEFMYFVVIGNLRYHPGDYAPEVGWAEHDPRLQLRAGDWCSEPSLWTIWTRLGTMEAMATTEVLSISAANLASTLSKFPEAAAILADYCSTYHKFINESGMLKSDLSWTVDLSEVLSGLDTDVRVQLATPVIHRLEGRFWTDHTRIELLKAEVANGKCDVGVVGNEVVRNTFVVALKVHKHSGAKERFLVKIGEVSRSTGTIVGSSLLPGVKRKWRESYSTAVERVLADDLGEIAEEVQINWSEGGSETITLQYSKTYGVRTRYLRMCFTATLSSGARLTYAHAPRWSTMLRTSAASSWSRLLRPNSSRQASNTVQRVAEILSGQDSIVVLRCNEANKSSRKFYLWLSQEELEVLATSSATPIIEGWLNQVEDSEMSITRLDSTTPEPKNGSPEFLKVAEPDAELAFEAYSDNGDSEGMQL